MQRFLGTVIGLGGLALVAFPEHAPIASAILSTYWLRAMGGGMLLIGLFVVWAAGS